MKGNILYGVRLLRVAPLAEDGKFESSPVWEAIDTPQQANVNTIISQGQSQEIRGGDRLLAVIQEDDQYIGMDIQFTDAVLNGEALAIIAGGTWDEVNGYDPPAMGENRRKFQAELYVANYATGSNHASDITGYTLFSFPNVSGSIPTWNNQDRNFTTPQMTLRARDSKAEGLPFFNFKVVSSLPEPEPSGS